MGKLIVGGTTYRLEGFSHPSEVDGRMQSTFTVSDPECLSFLQKMEKTLKIKKFKAKCQRGRLKGTFQVRAIYGSRVCIVRFYKYDYKQKLLDGHSRV